MEIISQGGNDGSSDGGGDNNRMLYQSLSTQNIFQYAHYVSIKQQNHITRTTFVCRSLTTTAAVQCIAMVVVTGSKTGTNRSNIKADNGAW